MYVAEALKPSAGSCPFKGGSGAEVVALLHKQLLTNGTYCQRSTVKTFEGGAEGGRWGDEGIKG
jgi:hypothetical protein